MARAIHNRKVLIAMTLIVAFVAIVVPTCRMVGCSMSGMMPFGHGGMDMPGFFGTCGGTWITNSAPTAIVPAGADSLVLALIAAVFAALMLMRPQAETRMVLVRSSDPPPPPEDPRGERLRL